MEYTAVFIYYDTVVLVVGDLALPGVAWAVVTESVVYWRQLFPKIRALGTHWYSTLLARVDFLHRILLHSRWTLSAPSFIVCFFDVHRRKCTHTRVGREVQTSILFFKNNEETHTPPGGGIVL